MSMQIEHTSSKYLTGGIFDSIETLGPVIKALNAEHNLIVPGGSIGGKLPPLYAAGLSFVFVDPEKETYPIYGKAERGMGKTALDRISAAAGIRWDPRFCGLVEESPNPYFVNYQAYGQVLQLDGTERPLHALKRIDLRAEQGTPVSTWGADAQEIARVADNATPKRDPWPQILQARQHILSNAESKAKNRAIRSLGIRTTYSLAEYAKGFVILRLQFTGRSEDPEVQREISMMIARRALTSTSALYGGPSMDTRELPPARPSRVVPRIATHDEPEEDQAEPETKPEAKTEEKPNTQAQDQAAPAASADAPKCPTENPELICGRQNGDGSWPKRPCSEFSIDELKVKIASYEKKRPSWESKWAAKNEAELRVMKAWLSFREANPGQAELPMDKAAAKTEKDPF
jgi:hypothetical protein